MSSISASCLSASSRLGRCVAPALVMSVIVAAGANADVTWTSAERFTHAGLVLFPRKPPGPPFIAGDVRHEFFGEGPFDTGPGSTFGASQTTLIDYADNAITGTGRASWQRRTPGLNFNTYGFAHSHIRAAFVLDEPTPYFSVFDLGGVDFGPRGCSLSSGTTIIPLLGGVHQGVLQPGAWTYDTFIGPTAESVMADPEAWGSGNVMTFNVSFHIPEPAGSFAALAASFVLLRRRRGDAGGRPGPR